MNLSTEDLKDYIDPAIKASALVVLIIYLRRIARVFMGPDGRFSVVEFGRFTGFIIFTYLAIYMIHKEANRTHEWQVFGELYILIVFTSLLAILHLDNVMDKVVKMLETILKLRMKGKIAKEEGSSEEKEP